MLPSRRVGMNQEGAVVSRTDGRLTVAIPLAARSFRRVSPQIPFLPVFATTTLLTREVSKHVLNSVKEVPFGGQ